MSRRAIAARPVPSAPSSRRQSGGSPSRPLLPAALYAKVSGFLVRQKVDIGDIVRKDEVLAEVDAPEFVRSRDQFRAALEQARAKVKLSLAHRREHPICDESRCTMDLTRREWLLVAASAGATTGGYIVFRERCHG